MMWQKEQFLYCEDSTVQVLGLPYEADHLTMYIILPKKRNGLPALEKSLTGKQILDLVRKTHKTKVVVQIPKFRLESRFSLNEALGNLGMGDMFSGVANLSKMTG